jgi:hypothetical protein
MPDLNTMFRTRSGTDTLGHIHTYTQAVWPERFLSLHVLNLLVQRGAYDLMVAKVGEQGTKKIEWKDGEALVRKGSSAGQLYWEPRLSGRVYAAIVVFNAGSYDKSHLHFVCKWVKPAVLHHVTGDRELSWPGTEFTWTLTKGRWWGVFLGEMVFVHNVRVLR